MHSCAIISNFNGLYEELFPMRVNIQLRELMHDLYTYSVLGSFPVLRNTFQLVQSSAKLLPKSAIKSKTFHLVPLVLNFY